jgi:hypothetical protein
MINACVASVQSKWGALGKDRGESARKYMETDASALLVLPPGDIVHEGYITLFSD